MMGNAEAKNIDYVFRADGTLQYRTAPGTPLRADGRWKIDGQRIVFMAGPLKGPVEVTDLHADSFTLNYTVLYRFRRGACAG
jgi:hypothetical protein